MTIMNSSALKLFISSTVFLIIVGAISAYVIYEQEKDGKRIYSSLVYLKSWESLQHSGVTEDQVNNDRSEKDNLKSIVLASEGEAVNFLALVDQLSSQTGVTITTTNLKIEKTKEAGFDELSATLLLRGERKAVEDLLKVFELLPYRSHIVALSLSRQFDGTAEASLSLAVSVKE
jgi:hypothetical protein